MECISTEQGGAATGAIADVYWSNGIN